MEIFRNCQKECHVPPPQRIEVVVGGISPSRVPLQRYSIRTPSGGHLYLRRDSQKIPLKAKTITITGTNTKQKWTSGGKLKLENFDNCMIRPSDFKWLIYSKFSFTSGFGEEISQIFDISSRNPLKTLKFSMWR